MDYDGMWAGTHIYIRKPIKYNTEEKVSEECMEDNAIHMKFKEIKPNNTQIKKTYMMSYKEEKQKLSPKFRTALTTA